LPVQQLTKLEFAINLQTARALGIEARPDVLSIADEVKGRRRIEYGRPPRFGLSIEAGKPRRYPRIPRPRVTLISIANALFDGLGEGTDPARR
jgi:hypothetical protein